MSGMRDVSGGTSQALLAGPDRYAALEIRVLGPLTVSRDDVAIPLGAVRQRAVLALLSISPGLSASRDEIVEALWANEPPPTAITMVQSYVSRLRRTLCPGSPGSPADWPVAATPNGYRLRPQGWRLDAYQFGSLSQEAREALGNGNPALACQLYQKALELWRGEPVCDLDILRDHPAVAGLNRRRAAAITEFAEAAVRHGWPDKALSHLHALAERDPLNEHAGAWLMLALAGCGQQAEALAVYEATRRRLDDQLGVEPGAELVAAHQQVLRQHVPAAGMTRVAVAALRSSDGQDETALIFPCCQLPPAVADFTGRSDEAALLTAALTRDPGSGPVPVVAVSGLPGVGKTSLALQVAHQVRDSFPDGQLWITLDGASSRPRAPAEVLGELLRMLGVHGAALPDSVSGRAALYRSRLAGQRVLVVADDAASAAQVEPLLPGTGGSAVIITSRSPLAAPPGARLLPLQPLTPTEANDLLSRIAGPARVAAERDAAADLAGACGMLPLAVRIAGARLAARPSWPISVLACKLSDQVRRLDELEAGNLSVRASVASSYEALDEAARQAFCLLGMLGPMEVAEWVVAALLGRPDAAGVVTELADKSLLSPTGVDATGQPRYRLHDLLRDYATERLSREPAILREEALGRVLNAWLQLATLAGSRLPREPYFPREPNDPVPGPVLEHVADSLTADPIAWLTAERLTLITAAELACANGRYGLAAHLGRALAGFHYLHTRPEDAERLWSAVLAGAQAAGDELTATRASLRLVAATCGRGRHAQALPAVERCVRYLEGQQESGYLVAALYWWAVCEWNLGHFGGCYRHAQRALDIARACQNRHGEFMASRMLGMAQVGIPGLAEQGVATCEHALRLVQGQDDLTCERELLHTVANAYNWTQRHSAVPALCQRGLALNERLGYPAGAAHWLGMLGEAYLRLGRYPEAIQTLSRVVSISERSHMQRYQALSLLKLGYTYQAMGNYKAAARYIEKSEPIFAELRLPHYVGRARDALESCRNGQFPDFTKPPADVASQSQERATRSAAECSALGIQSGHLG